MVKWRAIAIALLVSVVAGLIGVTEPVDRLLDTVRGSLAKRPVSGEIVVVGVDEKTLRETGSAMIPRPHVARLIKLIDEAGARRLFIDFEYPRRDGDQGLKQIADAANEMGERVILAVPSRSLSDSGEILTAFPDPLFGPRPRRASIAWENEFWQVWDVPLMYMADDWLLPSFAAELAGKRAAGPEEFRIDLSYDLRSIRHYSAVDVLAGKVGARELAGKDVIFAPTAAELQDRHFLPGHNRVPGAYIHLIAGETLKRGDPVNIGAMPALAFAAAALLLAIRFIGQRWLGITGAAIIAVLIVAKMVLAAALVTMSVGAAILLVGWVGAHIARRRRRFSAQRENPVSGLPNFEAMRSQAPFGSASVVAAKLVNFDDLAAFLPGEGSQQLVDQVARRLALACHDTQLHHDPEGSFAWLVPYYQHSQIEAQLAGLAALFNAPLTIGEQRIDVAIAFGVNDEFEGSNAQRLAAALVAAEKSIRSRSLWTKYTPRQREDAGWQLSFHSQLEEALTGGDIWVAFQPQYDIRTRELAGVEALVRWTHPTRGPIPPDEFIVQAEKSQDIYRLTLFVMDQAIRSAAQMRDKGFDINMSVNLSAALLDHDDLVGTIRVMLTAHHLPPERLTIEITETAQIENSGRARQTLGQLRRAGVRLSIDDYGTGQSNLEYLTDIEADEIKIDKRFVMTMRDSQRNLEVVKSTIDLAHRLGAVAVAEGIEDVATFALLEQLGCDVGQGYHLGKPQLFTDLLNQLTDRKQSRTA